MPTIAEPTPPKSFKKKSLFELPDGRTVAFTFFLVSSLFLIWGFCNGMIDTMDKHFQDQLNLSKAQSAWVQFAHYMGYAIMALPAGFLTRKLGYKGGIVFGLLLVALGGFWFLPATKIAAFWAFLMGVCLIAMGLTVLETVANPYTTVLGPKEYGATRINLAQSFNGVGWILGPIVGAAFFYSQGGAEKAQRHLFIPYVGVAIIVLLIAAMFIKAPVPDVKVEDEYHTDDKSSPAAPVAREHNRGLIVAMMFLNVVAVGLSIFLILHTILPSLNIVTEHVVLTRYAPVIILAVFATLPFLMLSSKKVTGHSIWAHPHFSGATLAQFVYVAAQAGIFSFFINSMTVDKSNGYTMVPPLPASWNSGFLRQHGFIETRAAFAPKEIKDFPAVMEWLKAKNDPVAAFVNSQLSAKTMAAVNSYQTGAAVPAAVQKEVVQDLNQLIRQEINNKPGRADNKPALYDAQRFAGVKLSDKTQALIAKKDRNDHEVLQMNRYLLQDAFPAALTYNDGLLAISDKGASELSSLAFIFFLLGRISGSWFLKKSPAHKILGLYAFLNVGVCALIIGQLGWISVLCVFLSYFFMSIMYPTIFAVGIHGLGSQSKKKAAAFIVMAITGGALMPKFMGYLGDVINMSAAFWMPLGCFILIGLYAFAWPKLSQSEGVIGMKASGGH
ncbi:MAG TPA: MFS transporter [Candidatus Angelobacter sp.]|nr:MFS transporter [Candidatus Angelobacter sp.]